MKGLNNIIINKKYTEGSNIISSGPIPIRGTSAIKEITIFVNEQLEYPLGTLGVNAGLTTDGQEIIKFTEDSFAPRSDQFTPGRACSTNPNMLETYGGNKTLQFNPIVLSTSNMYYNIDNQLHITVTSNKGPFTSGVLSFYVEYITLKSI